MVTIWVRKRGDAENSEIKLLLDHHGHVSDVLTKSAEVLWFAGHRMQAGGLQAETPDGRLLSNREPISRFDGGTLVVAERTDAVSSAYNSAATPLQQQHSQRHHPSAGGGSYPQQHSHPRSGYNAFPSAHSGPAAVAADGHSSQAFVSVDSRSPGGTPAQAPVQPAPRHTCAGCGMPILGLKVVLTLPGSPSAVDLHPECEVEFERAHALSCTYCADLILDRLTTLTGDFGTINLHPQCVEPYKRSDGPGVGVGRSGATGQEPHHHGMPGQLTTVGGGGGYHCAQCKGGIEGTKVALKLPGFSHKVDLHPQCEYTYAVNTALRCDHCQQPMLDGITVLTGNFGKGQNSKQLHPSCVTSFKQSHSGHGNDTGSWTPHSYTPASTQWKPIVGATSATPVGAGVRFAPVK